MPVESQAPTMSTTPRSLPESLSYVEQPGAFDSPASTVDRVRESLAVSRDQARLKMRVLELVKKLVETAYAQFLDKILGESLLPLDLDIVCFEAGDREDAQLEARLRMAFDADPLEDGIDHQAERIIDDALRSGEGRRIFAWLRECSLDARDPGFASSVLRCLGRRRPGTPAWRAGIVSSALAVDDVEMRDAAVQAAEAWGGPEVFEVLQRHTEAVPWLRAYVEDVVEDLRE